MSGGGDQDDGYIVKLRGLPWSATTDDILKFFRNCKIAGGIFGIHMTTSREGRPSGEAFVEFEDAEDMEIALHKDREHIGSRYIEVFKVKKAEMEWVIKRSGPTYGSNEDGCVRLRGLPFGCSKEEIAQFFTGLEIVPNGITLLTDYSGRSSGEAYVQFVNREVAEKALLKHREKIGHRYIEIFRSSLSEVNSVLVYPNRRGGNGGGGGANNGGGSGGGGGSGMFNSRPSPYERNNDRYGGGRFQSRGSRSFKGANFSNNLSDYEIYDRGNNWSNKNYNNCNNNDGGVGGRGGRSPYDMDMDSWSNGGGGDGMGDRNSNNMHCVHMRGLPFKATMNDISDFFKPIVPVNVRLLQDHTGRASGEADVEFASHDDAVRAMSKDKGHMQHRYIELFLNSSGPGGGPPPNNGWGNGGGGGGGGYGRKRI